MPFCPKCRYEHVPGFKVCPDCGAELVDELPPPETSYSSEPIITIATYSHPIEANVSKARLESEGIPSFIADEHTVIANWLYSNALGGVRLQVRESDAERAKLILKEGDTTQSQFDEQVGDGCPRCNSLNVHYEPLYLRPTFLTWLLLAFPITSEGGFFIPFFRKKKWRCGNCGYRWK